MLWKGKQSLLHYMHPFVKVCEFVEWKRICAASCVCFLCIADGDLIVKREWEDWYPIDRFITATCL